MPGLAPVAAPNGRPSSTRNRPKASAARTVWAPAMSRQATQLTQTVRPSVNDCIACRMSSEVRPTRSRTAPNTTPTSSRRRVC